MVSCSELGFTLTGHEDGFGKLAGELWYGLREQWQDGWELRISIVLSLTVLLENLDSV